MSGRRHGWVETDEVIAYIRLTTGCLGVATAMAVGVNFARVKREFDVFGDLFGVTLTGYLLLATLAEHHLPCHSAPIR